MKKITCILLFCIISTILSCEGIRYPKFSIQVVNNSDSAISTFFAFPTIYDIGYPDTLLPINEIAMQVAKPKESNYHDFGYCLNEVFELLLPSDTLSVYYFSTDTLEKYTWEEIRNGYRILRRDDLPKPTNIDECGVLVNG